MSYQPDLKYVKQYEEITETLMEYGWIISPSMIGRDFQRIYKLVCEIRSNALIDDQTKEFYQNAIENILSDIIFHPLFRAFFVYRAKELNYLKSFSHHIERAILHYFKNDYFSTVLCLLPAIEGVLLSYYGWQYGGNRKPAINTLILEIEKCRKWTLKATYYRLYSNALSAFLRKWIFSDTSISDMSYSYLNRHYVLHGMGTNNYYSIADANRLLMFFDLFTEFIALEDRKEYPFIPENNSQINERRDYYFRFIEKNIRKDEIMKSETEFMKENLFYNAETKIPNWDAIVERAVVEHLKLMKELEIKFGGKK